MKLCFWDISTQCTAEELPNKWADIDKMGISIIAGMIVETSDLKTNSLPQIFIFREDEILNFRKLISDCEIMVGWNNLKFDNVVFKKYLQMDEEMFFNKKHIDLREATLKNCNFKVALDGIAYGLGMDKPYDGKKAVEWFRKGHWYELLRYAIGNINIYTNLFFKITNSQNGQSIIVRSIDGMEHKLNLNAVCEELWKIFKIG